MFNKILIANRGEIAVRIMRACRELGVASAAVYSEADREALFVRYADEALPIGPARAQESYLNISAIVAAARQCGAEAVHPGYGFLAENADFASACEAAGIKFIGPSSQAIRLLGDKLKARQLMREIGVPILPGSEGPVDDLEQAKTAAAGINYPLLIKPAAGGGGIGMNVVNREEELPHALASSRRIALSTFKSGELFIEKYLLNPRHIEFQVLGDSFDNVIHLGERECSIQRRHQKLIEESPSAALTADLRAEMGEKAVRIARAVHYQGPGTIEFLLAEGRYYFLEANTRLQVEHPVTEWVTGVDIVREQIQIAAGLPISLRQNELVQSGHALECRINAEDPLYDFAPSVGRLSAYREPGGLGVRVDSGVFAGCTISQYYDPLIAKLICWGHDRPEAIRRVRRALYEYVITGVKTNIIFHQAVMQNAAFRRGDLSTTFIDREGALFEEMRNIAAQPHSLQEKLGRSLDARTRAVLGAAAAVDQSLH